MSKIETNLTYRLTSYEEAVYLLAKYFIERNFEADVIEQKEGAYTAIISKQGLIKNLLGSRTVFSVTFSPEKITENEKEYDGTSVQIESKIMSDGLIKELATYILIIPALRKLGDYAKILNLCKKKSLDICEKLRIYSNDDTKTNIVDKEDKK